MIAGTPPFRDAVPFLLWVLVHIALTLGTPPTTPGDHHSDPDLYLMTPRGDGQCFTAVRGGIGSDERNLVVVTHGWYEREAWPENMARAIREATGRQTWCCGWYDWRGRARRLFPQDAAASARDSVGPQLGQAIVELSRDWKHVHLIGHSAGVWAINEAARTVARQTSASIHLTFLDAYVPSGWDEKELGAIVADPNVTCWVEHYFTRERALRATETALMHAYNVDVTAANPGFNGHKFPWHWYHATIRGRFTTRAEFAEATVLQQVDDLACGFARARESGEAHWQRSLQLAPGAVAVAGEKDPPGR